MSWFNLTITNRTQRYNVSKVNSNKLLFTFSPTFHKLTNYGYSEGTHNFIVFSGGTPFKIPMLRWLGSSADVSHQWWTMALFISPPLTDTASIQHWDFHVITAGLKNVAASWALPVCLWKLTTCWNTCAARFYKSVHSSGCILVPMKGN